MLQGVLLQTEVRYFTGMPVNNVVGLSADIFSWVNKPKDISYSLILILTKYAEEQMVPSFLLNAA